MTTWKQQLKHALVPIRGLNDNTATLVFVERIRDVANARNEEITETAVVPCKATAAATARKRAILGEADFAIAISALALKAALTRPYEPANGGLVPGVDRVKVAGRDYRLDKVIATGWLEDDPAGYVLLLKQETP